MFMKMYKINPFPLQVVPAQRRRQWMNENPHVYKCGPVTNCNSFGWDVLTIEDHVIEWNGGTKKEDLIVYSGSTAHSNFGHGVLTFNFGYTFHTPEDWSIYVTSVPNEPNDQFLTISAMIETDVLKYPFFPSVTIKNAGKLTIKKDTAICRLIPIKISEVIECEPSVENEPSDFLEYRIWQSEKRNKFKADKGKGWQKFYHERANYPVIKMKNVKNNINP
jgi:hypothetical protein